MSLEERPKLAIEYRCPDCNSSNTYYRHKSKDFICRKCGKVFNRNINKSKRKE